MRNSSEHYICSIDGCLKKHYALGLCRYHWTRNNIKRKQDNSLWEKIKENDIHIYIDKALSVLNETQRKIITLRLLNQMSMQKVSKKCNVTSERIRQIEKISLCKMKKQIQILKKKENDE
jgi:DNA-directed RNA polymerase sigma subunit (sigma70/sigma32)